MGKLQKIFISIAAVVCFVCGWGNLVSANSERPIRVVTGRNFYREVAKQVAGQHGQVTSFM